MNTKTVSIVEQEIRNFLGRSPVEFFVGGQWTAGQAGKTFQTLDPGSGEVLASVHEASESDVNTAVEAAAEAFRRAPWANLAPNERAVHLHRLADLVESRAEVLAEIESLDVG